MNNFEKYRDDDIKKAKLNGSTLKLRFTSGRGRLLYIENECCEKNFFTMIAPEMLVDRSVVDFYATGWKTGYDPGPNSGNHYVADVQDYIFVLNNKDQLTLSHHCHHNGYYHGTLCFKDLPPPWGNINESS